MRRFHHRQRVRTSAAEAFDFAVEHQPENHPSWESEVVSVRRDGPARLGARGIMVRNEWGKTQDAPFEIVDLVPGRKVAYRSGTGGFHLHLIIDFEPVGTECDLVVNSTVTLSGAMRLMWPLMWFMFPVRSRRITRSLAAVLDARAVSS
jgi:hypothetical protein